MTNRIDPVQTAGSALFAKVVYLSKYLEYIRYIIKVADGMRFFPHKSVFDISERKKIYISSHKLIFISLFFFQNVQ